VPEKELEISPTAPFVQHEADNQQLEIGPTAAFVPKMPETKALEISQTQPFVPRNEPVQISQTQPFVGKAAEATISPTQLVDSGNTPASTMPAAPGAENKKSLAPRPAASPLRRTASHVSDDDSLSDSPSDDGALGEGEENAVRQNPQQRKREREWLRHNRQTARKEAKETMERIKRRKVGGVDDHSSLLSTKERSRYEELVSNSVVTTKTAGGVSEATRLLRGGEAADEAEVFGGFRGAPGGIVKKKTFFMK